jgi:ribonucleoside-diphosphate reductase beta chain
MASLLDLTSQGDVATIADESSLPRVTLMDPQQLYELWERQQWSSHTIDFSTDVGDWAGLPAQDKVNLSWNLSSFFVGEERVTTQFTGLVAAYESQAEEAFLATQQVDEARHAQHFNNLYEQVLGIDGSFEHRLQEAR